MKPLLDSTVLCAIALAAAVVGMLLFVVGEVFAVPGPVVAEAEKDGIDALVAAAVAALTALAGWLVRTPQDMWKRRQNGAQAPTGANGRVDAGQRALEELAEHERQCAERMKAVYARIEGVETRLGRLEEKVSSVQADVAFIRGVLTPTGGKQS